jgi:hypothetical protein
VSMVASCLAAAEAAASIALRGHRVAHDAVTETAEFANGGGERRQGDRRAGLRLIPLAAMPARSPKLIGPDRFLKGSTG